MTNVELMSKPELPNSPKRLFVIRHLSFVI